MKRGLQYQAVLSNLLLRLAVSLLPAEVQERFLNEWCAEVDGVRQHAGERAAITFARQLVVAAPRMTLAMRGNSKTGYAEMSIGLLCSVFPSSVLVVIAIRAQMWLLLVGELALIAGLMLTASGLWSYDGRLFDSPMSRFGIVLVTVGSGVEIYVRRVLGFGPPIDKVLSADIPHTMMFLGLVLLVSSSYAGRFRRRVQLVAVVVFAPAALLNGIVALVNGFALSGFDRFAVLMYVVPSIAFAWASYSVVGRKQVFEDSPMVQA